MTIKKKQANSMLKKYGVKYYVNDKNFVDKSDQTKLKKYDNKKYVNPTAAQETKKLKYGDKNYNNHEKVINTCIKKYGVNHVMQSKEIFEKQQSKLYGSKKYKHLYYRGSYELLFIKEFEKLFPITDLQNCFPVKYNFNNKTHIYFPDFLFVSKKIIVEIKSSWTYDNNGKNETLRNINDIKWDAAMLIKNHSFVPLKSKNEIKLFFNLIN